MDSSTGPSGQDNNPADAGTRSAQPTQPPGTSSSSPSQSSASASFSASSRSRRTIPTAPFVENVAEFVGDRDVDAIFRSLEERLQQYKMVDMKLLAQQRDLQGKIPEIKRSLQVVERLQQHQASGSQDPLVADFEVAKGIFAKASIPSAETVCLWLGANVMLEYSTKEAVELLQSNLSNADASLKALLSDMDFLRDQMNTTEVTMARLHNWNIKRRREKK